MTRRLMLVVTEDWYLWSHRIGLAVAARDAGYDVTVVTRVDAHGERIRALGLHLVDLDFGRGRLSPVANRATLRALCAVYRRCRPDLVHHVAIKPIVLGTTAAARAGVPMTVNALTGLGTGLIPVGDGVRALDGGRGSVGAGLRPVGVRARLLGVVLRATLGVALRRPRSHTIVQNPENARFVESLGVRPERISLVRGAGVDIGRFRPRPEPDGPVRVTMVSRLLRDKGVLELVEAARLVREMRGDVVFTLVGTPDEENPSSVSRRQVRSWVEAGLVQWWGYREDVADVLARSHIAVLPSYGEGMPKTLLEATACGRPIVATDVPGCREVVRHGVNGLLVPVRDARALADAIMALADDPAQRAAMGAEGRRRAEEEFAAARIHQETLRVYERALALSSAVGGG